LPSALIFLISVMRKLSAPADGDVRLVEPALLVGGVFPQPPAFALLPIGQDSTRAWFLADAHEAALVQLVVGHVIAADVVPDLGGGLVRERVELDQGMLGRRERRIALDHRDGGARREALILRCPVTQASSDWSRRRNGPTLRIPQHSWCPSW
jgi:hypothetical protein